MNERSLTPIQTQTQNKACINVGGFEPFTTVDFPEHLACVVFCQGCTWRCGYCYNKHLQNFEQKEELTWKDIIRHLNKRKKLLDGVVFSGGEPLCQKNLPEAIKEVKSLGFKVALHTSGSIPEMLEKVLFDLDWIGLDIKAPFNGYDDLTAFKNSSVSASKSLDLILKAKKIFETRTTLYPYILNKEMVLNIADFLSKKGVENYALQEYKSLDDEPRSINENSDHFFTDESFLDKVGSLFKTFQVRRCGF